MENPETDPALMPYLEHALNEMMDAIYAGIPVVSWWVLKIMAHLCLDYFLNIDIWNVKSLEVHNYI